MLIGRKLLKPGSMITIDYTASIVEEEKNRVFDTTEEAVAAENDILKESKVYEPMLVVIGKGWIPFGLEKRLQNASIGDQFTVTVGFDEAYGPKDPSKIKLVARREFQKLNINPSVGDRVQIGNQKGTVLSVSSGRVRMDYNHILAGKDIQYNIVIHEEIKGDENQITALIKRRLPRSNLAEMLVELHDSEIDVHLPEQARYYEYVQFAKAEVVKDIGEILPEYTRIRFIESYDVK